jgi:hypothetical protein
MHVYYHMAIINFYNIKKKQQYKQTNQLKINFIIIIFYWIFIKALLNFFK